MCSSGIREGSSHEGEWVCDSPLPVMARTVGASEVLVLVVVPEALGYMEDEDIDEDRDRDKYTSTGISKGRESCRNHA